MSHIGSGRRSAACFQRAKLCVKNSSPAPSTTLRYSSDVVDDVWLTTVRGLHAGRGVSEVQFELYCMLLSLHYEPQAATGVARRDRVMDTSSPNPLNSSSSFRL